MDDLEFDTTRNDNAVSFLRDKHADRWEEIADATVFTKRQLAMWELSVVFDQENRFIAKEFGISETTIARHCERFREKRDQLEEEFEIIQTSLRYVNTRGNPEQ